MPAHLLVKICWVSNEDLHELEESYKDWLQLKAGLKEDTDNNILKRFISILTSLKSIYPESNLQNCNEDKLRQLFVLNKNSLGTQKSS